MQPAVADRHALGRHGAAGLNEAEGRGWDALAFVSTLMLAFEAGFGVEGVQSCLGDIFSTFALLVLLSC